MYNLARGKPFEEYFRTKISLWRISLERGGRMAMRKEEDEERGRLDLSMDLGGEAERSPQWSTTHYCSLLLVIAAENDVDVIASED